MHMPYHLMYKCAGVTDSIARWMFANTVATYRNCTCHSWAAYMCYNGREFCCVSKITIVRNVMYMYRHEVNGPGYSDTIWTSHYAHLSSSRYDLIHACTHHGSLWRLKNLGEKKSSKLVRSSSLLVTAIIQACLLPIIKACLLQSSKPAYSYKCLVIQPVCKC